MNKTSVKSSKPKSAVSKKQSLRKFQLVSGLIAFVIVAAGAGAVSVLSQRSADNRSDASGEPITCNTPCRFEDDCKKFNSNYTCHLFPVVGDETPGPKGVCRLATALDDVNCRQSEAAIKVPVGWIDTVTNNVVTGWAADPDDLNSSIKVQFYLDGPARSNEGKYLGEVVANKPRPDVNTHLGVPNSTAKHGYEFAIPADLADGKEHKIFAYGIDISGIVTANALLEPTAGKSGTLIKIAKIVPTIKCNDGASNTAVFSWPHNVAVEKYVLRIDRENTCTNSDGKVVTNGWFCGSEQGFPNDTGDQWVSADAATYCKSGTCTMLRTIVPNAKYTSASIQWLLKGEGSTAEAARMGISQSFTCSKPSQLIQPRSKTTPKLKSIKIN